MFKKIAQSVGEDQALYVQRMNQFQSSYQYEKYIMSAVKRMVTPLADMNWRTWREAARKSTQGRFLYSLLTEELEQGRKVIIDDQVFENAALIRTLPNDVAQKVVKDIEKEFLKGKRARSIEKIIRQETDKHSRASARLIARTEVSKTQSALTKARAQALDMQWYVWRTALDGNRVRPSHRLMEGVLVNWNDPPSPEALAGEKNVGYYHAGNIWNCRCYSDPLLDMDDVKWPHKVYRNGQIQMMGKREFQQIM
nr:MAG TPA: Minor capsid component [Caudoviricetes sp.]